MIEVYTDGSCFRNPGPGGWSAIVVQDGRRRELSGHEDSTTNNRMELTAALRGLAATPEGADVVVYSDSEYLVKTMKGALRQHKNTDLWQMLKQQAATRRVSWVWVEGHAGHPENERAHTLAARISAPEERLPASLRPTHFDASGQVHMVDVSDKDVTQRVATARGTVRMEVSTLELIQRGEAAKGDVLSVAQTAGIMAAKKTAELIPLCHPLQLAKVSLEFQLDHDQATVEITATAKASDKTGVEMEALTAVAVSALTIYDMCKAVDRGMRIDGIRLVRKSGGRSGTIILE